VLLPFLPSFLPSFLLCNTPSLLRTDASLLGTGGVLMQDGRVISYISRKFSSAETRYHTGEQELLALIHALKEWRCYLEGVRVRLITDHHPLVYLQTQSSLSRRQACWVEYMQRFDFELVYAPGCGNVADPLSRWSPEVQAAVLAVVLGVSTRRQAAQQDNAQGESVSPVPGVVGPSSVPADTSGSTRPKRSTGAGRDKQDIGSVRTGQVRKRRSGRKRHTRVPAAVQPAVPDLPIDLSHVPASTSLLDDLRAAYAANEKYSDPAYTDGLTLDSTGLWRMANGQIWVPDDTAVRSISSLLPFGCFPLPLPCKTPL
jgi:hypothetical protein